MKGNELIFFGPYLQGKKRTFVCASVFTSREERVILRGELEVFAGGGGI